MIVLNGYWQYMIVLMSIISAILYALYYYCNSTHSLWKTLNVPYISPIPVFGSYFRVAFGFEQQVDLYRRIYYQLAGHKYGGFFQMRTPYLMIRDPELIKAILIKDFMYFQDRGVDTNFSINPLSRSLFFTQSREWKVMRNKLSSTFTSSRLNHMYNQIQVCSNLFINNLRETLTETDEIDLKTVCSKYTTDVLGTCFFGLKMNAITDETSAFHKYGSIALKPSLRTLVREICVMINPALLKLLGVTDFPSECVQFFNSTFWNTIKYRTENNIVRNDFVQILMEVRKDMVSNENIPSEENLTDAHIISNAFVMFTAGLETLSSSMSFCLYELSLKKHIQDRARDEIKYKLSQHGGSITSGILSELNYLDMIIDETLRKYPATYALFRQASQTYHVPNDSLTIAKGQKIVIPIFSLHFNPEYYPDPEVFDPERFSPEEKLKRQKTQSSTYIPFGEGPRMCIAKRFATVALKMALIEILTNYELQPCERTEIPIRLGAGFIVVLPESEVWLKLKLIDADNV